MDVRPALSLGLPEEPFDPLAVGCRCTRRDMVMPDVLHAVKPDTLERKLDEGIEIPDGDLDIDHILGGKSRYRGRANMIDAHSKLS